MGTTIDSEEWQEGSGETHSSASEQEEDPDAIAAFRDLLHICCVVPDDQQFWHRLEAGIQAMEQSMAPERLSRFEHAVDHILVLHGLPAWSLVKNGSGRPGPPVP